MALLTCTKEEFINYINDGYISNKVYNAYKKIYNHKTKLSEIKSWANSLPYLKEVLEALPKDTGIAIEYNIPYTSKRIDAVISGYDIYHKPKLILIELKQWEYAKKVDNQDGIVRTRIGSKEKSCLHPAYQVKTYKELLENYNLGIEELEIEIIPFVYLHNYELTLDDDLYSKKYNPYYKNVYMFGKNDIEELKYKIENIIYFGDNLQIINTIETSKNKPTKKLVTSLNNMLKAKKTFALLDEQKVILEEIHALALEGYESIKKKVIIIKGGPGTGKSVLAIVTLGELISLGLIGCYVTKNMAPRHVYKDILTNGEKNNFIDNLFKSSSRFFKETSNQYDFLLIDEAHRLQEKSGMRSNIGENQIKEIINASKVSVFFIDEAQAITLKDIGKISSIKEYASIYNADIYEYELTSEFRCNGSDNYLGFIEAILYNRRPIPSFDFDFQIIDSPQELHNKIKEKNTNNNARLVAGFCWRRNAKEADNQEYHDIKIDDFSISWNLKHDTEFAIRESAINEAGCIYNVQGLEFDYIGVIIGPDLKYENKQIVSDYHERANTEKSLYGLQVLIKENKEYYEKEADTIIRNTYRVLLTRGIKGCYVYICDKNLEKYLKQLLYHYKINNKKSKNTKKVYNP